MRRDSIWSMLIYTGMIGMGILCAFLGLREAIHWFDADETAEKEGAGNGRDGQKDGQLV